MVKLEEDTNAKWYQVENQLKRRSDLIPNLVSTVKGYADHEEDVILELTKARSGILEADTPQDLARANNDLAKALTSLYVVVEDYPDLKANENFVALQDELVGTENRLAIARMDYNEFVKKFNSSIRVFPMNIVSRMCRFNEKVYFGINQEDYENPKVDF